ncbi:tetratricopeptide (TPR) repeat protein [Algoriphagus sp. 4150]|uniref:RagB/SusD family nutrient uptake outer membrane protein n=1 Tax=Algoriphagus sp. 4150 TaxID=2817756 RepID=UPI002862F03E|nr:RagB/SusD family nutrient uptake outer membrane protein [Algoriphagus sp. 4150]MDR7127702.1 tetratricopeptide (TPR) repeat protein [Algoriphagus sp. 4150]
MKNKPILYLLVIACCMAESSCGDFLDAKPEKAIVVPSTLTDLQALLDNGNRMNVYSGISDIGTDDIYIEDGALDALSNPIVEGNSYLWKEDILEGLGFSEWSSNYTAILYANIVLEQLEAISTTNADRASWETIKGSALYFRAYSYYDLLRIFSKAYDPMTSSSDLGIPLRLSSTGKMEVERSTVEASFRQVIEDLAEALILLPDLPREYPTRPSKQSVTGLLARIYLEMGDYEKAIDKAKQCIDFGGELLNYNSLDSTVRYPFPQFNSEVIFHSLMISYSYIRLPTTIISEELIDSYQKEDLRKHLYFDRLSEGNKSTFRGSYSSGFRGFNGIALDEIYLILAESYIRINQTDKGMEVLNHLLQTRWQEGSFEPLVADNVPDALTAVLAERRKSLVLRGIRWADLKRLNKEPGMHKTIERIYQGEYFFLDPASDKYIYPIPDNEISMNPISQNQRND